MEKVPVLHVICGEEELETTGFLSRTAGLFQTIGEDLALHLRARELSARRLYEWTVDLAAAAREFGGWCVVNGRADIALAGRAQAVQLGSAAPPVAAIRAWAPGDLAIGVSVHGVDEARGAVRDGANVLLLGTIFPTPTHPGRPGAGPGLIGEVRTALRNAGLEVPPIVAIGGIDARRVRSLKDAGAQGIAVRRAVWSREDPVAAARELWEAWGGTRKM